MADIGKRGIIELEGLLLEGEALNLMGFPIVLALEYQPDVPFVSEAEGEFTCD